MIVCPGSCSIVVVVIVASTAAAAAAAAAVVVVVVVVVAATLPHNPMDINSCQRKIGNIQSFFDWVLNMDLCMIWYLMLGYESQLK